MYAETHMMQTEKNKYTSRLPSSQGSKYSYIPWYILWREPKGENTKKNLEKMVRSILNSIMTVETEKIFRELWSSILGRWAVSIRSTHQKLRQRLCLHREGIYDGIIGGFRNVGHLLWIFAADKQSRLVQYRMRLNYIDSVYGFENDEDIVLWYVMSCRLV
jgi:hypothetical protein